MSPDLQPVSREIQSKLETYEALLRKWQTTINLISPSTLQDVRLRHFEDSWQLAQFIPLNAKTLYDLGSGAGFPGLVLATARPDLDVHLFEVDQRKSSFLKTVSRETRTPVRVHTCRVETADVPPPDVITARALASLCDLLNLTEPWWASQPTCTLIFPKGAAFDTELVSAKESYDFILQIHPSETDEKARILVLSEVRRL